MGTRGSVGFIINKEPKLTYNHFDSYPSGLGELVINYIKRINKNGNWEEIKQKVASLIKVNELDKPSDEMFEKYKQYSQQVSNGPENDWYALLRDLQGIEWLEELDNIEHMIFNNDFIKDSLFCEYAYIINLDSMTLEFYEGFQKKPQIGNKFGEESINGYYPCAKILELSLSEVDNINSSYLNREYDEETGERKEIKLLLNNED